MAEKKVNRIVWTEPCIADLDAIADYIAIDNRDAAAKLVRKIVEAVGRLARFPQLGRRVPELLNLPYLELIISPCRVIYRIEGDVVYIVMITRGEQLVEEHRLWRSHDN